MAFLMVALKASLNGGGMPPITWMMSSKIADYIAPPCLRICDDTCRANLTFLAVVT